MKPSGGFSGQTEEGSEKRDASGGFALAREHAFLGKNSLHMSEILRKFHYKIKTWYANGF